jgi:anti-anti-sigma factor
MDRVAEELFYQENDSGLFVKAQGHVTAAVSTDLRELILGRLTQAPVPPVLAADLSECDYMDSTFMGLLVGFHKRYKVLTGRALTILRPSAECVKLLNGLGILKLMTLVTGQEPPSPTVWTGLRAQRAPSTEVVLHAHKNLSEISQENEKKFSVLQGVLQRELEKKDPI